MPFPDEPCAACPRTRRGLPMPCRAMVKKHARYCDLAEAGSPAHVAMLCGDDPALPRMMTHAATTVPVAVSARRLKMARACEYRTDPKCGCAGMATCLLGKGKGGQVSLSECVQCIAEREPD